MLYQIKRIVFNGQHVPVILQAVNGPCPLLAVCNVLLLRGKMQIVPEQRQISFEELCLILEDYLQGIVTKITSDQKSDESKIASALQSFDDAQKLLPSLEEGLDINVIFNHCLQFEYTPAIGLLDLFNIRLVHGWVYDPQDEKLAKLLGNLSYNQVLNLMTQLQTAPSSAPADDQKRDSSAPMEEEARDHQLAAALSDQTILKSFLDESQGQLTVIGLAQMHETLGEEELSILFRNNHFATITKRRGHIFALVTDAGVARASPVVVWQRIGSIDGDDVFFDAEFRVPGHDPPPSSSSDPATNADELVARQLQQQYQQQAQPQPRHNPGYQQHYAQLPDSAYPHPAYAKGQEPSKPKRGKHRRHNGESDSGSGSCAVL